MNFNCFPGELLLFFYYYYFFWNGPRRVSVCYCSGEFCGDDDDDSVFFLPSVPVRRFLTKPQMVGSSPHSDGTSQARTARFLLTKVQRSSHKHHQEVSYQIRVRLGAATVDMCGLLEDLNLSDKLSLDILDIDT